MSPFLISVGLSLVNIFGDAKLKADVDCYVKFQKMSATPEGIDFFTSLSKAVLLNFGTAVSKSPLPPEEKKELGEWIMTPGGHLEWKEGS
jgi:hypothetical protein